MTTTTINPNQLIRKIHSSRKRKAADSLTTHTIKRRSPNKQAPAPTPTRKFSTTFPSSFSFARLHSSEPAHSLIPLDWGIKDQVRVTSRVPISWAATMSSAQVSHGTNLFVKDNVSADQDTKSQFRESLLTWIHPALPLITSNNTSSSSRQRSSLLPEGLLDEMRQDWQVALTSALQHLNAGQCPYFYLLTSSLAVLFLDQADSGKKQTRALIAGASDKLRALMQKEGVQVQETSSGPTNTETVDAGDWLQGIGINSKDLSIDADKNNHNHSGSAAALTTSDVRGLVNLLLNYEPLFSNGVPSLLSPNPFEGATLRAARYKSGLTEEEGEKVSFVEISGPMLPHNMLRLHRLLRSEHSEYAMKLRSVSVSESIRVQGGAGLLLSQGDCSLRSQPVSKLVYTDSMYYM